MAVRIVQEHTCDVCKANDLPDVAASHHHVISIDGGPFKRLDFCNQSDKAFQDAIVRVYEEQGDELRVEPKEEQPKAKTTAPKKVPAAKKPKAIEAPRQEEPATAPKKPKKMLRCPEPHKSNGGHPMEVDYVNRGTHVDMCHPGQRMWDVKWEDPYGHLAVPCTSHAECMKTGLAFASKQGMSQHRHSCPLPRIDNPEQSVDGHPH